MSEEIYYRGGKRDEFVVDPDSLNLDELPLTLAMSGWSVSISYPQAEGGAIRLWLSDMGGASGKSAAEVAVSFNMIDAETGELLPGYGVSEEYGRVQVNYQGIADIRFAEFVKTLHGLSPWS